DLQLSTCQGVLERQVGQVATHHRVRDRREEGEKKGQTGLKKPHPGLEQKERHQAGALLLLLWAAAAPQPPHSSHSLPTPTPPAPAWHRPGEQGEVSKHGGAQEGGRKAQGKSRKEGEESGALPLSPAEPRPGGLAQPRLERCETLKEMALHSKMSLLVEATSHLLHVAHLLLPLLQQSPLPLHPSLRIN
ncbi:hypothetical protein Nmel_002586, partial [Mimus melanotis]